MKNFERAKFLALKINNGNFEARMSLDNDLQTDSNGGKQTLKKLYIQLNNLKQFRNFFQMHRAQDGTRCIYCKSNRTHGHWSRKEQTHHK